MKVEEAGLSEWLLDALRREGIEKLYPPQAEALRRGLLAGRNIVVSSPTASGKTLIAIMAAHRHLEAGRKILYLTPLRALTYEKAVEFRRILGESGPRFRVASVSGDYDDPGEWIGINDVIVSTYEKADSLVRHRASWLSGIGLIVVDEAHMIGDPERGPTLEMTIAKLLETLESPQILCLSATVRNVDDLAEWLEAVPIVSDFRPVPLREGVVFGGRVLYADGESRELRVRGDILSAAVLDSLWDGGQVLVFSLSRRRAESYAERLAHSVSGLRIIDGDRLSRLEEYARLIREESESPFSEKLASLVVRGSAFHHAGLSYTHRRLVEDAFRDGVIPVLSATPTLAAGVNLPARTVVIPEHRRFNSKIGSRSLTVTEYKQFCGRAGRPLYDKIGYALLLASSRIEAEYLVERYIRGEPERVYSALGNERHLRSHILSLIASRLARSVHTLSRVMGRTFYAHIFGARGLSDRIERVLDLLEEHSLITRESGLEATRLGARVSELYIDPLTCIDILSYTEGVDRLSTLAALQLLCLTPDLSDLVVTRLRASTIMRMLEEMDDEPLVKPPDPDDRPGDYELILDSLRNSLVLWAWVNEVQEREIYEDFGVEPGDLAALRERAEWISYAASSILEVVGRGKFSSLYRVLTERIRHGVKPELLEIVTLPQVGRVRGRALWLMGYRSLEEIRRASVEELARVPGIGAAIAAGIKRATEGLDARPHQ